MTSALPVLSTTTCFSSIIAASQPVRLPAGSPIPSCSRRFRLRFMSRIAFVSLLGPLFEQLGEPSRRRFRHQQAFPHRLSGVSCAVPAGFPFVFSSVSRLSSLLPQSESEYEGRSVSSDAVRSMPSLSSPFRSPARRARRVAFRGVGRGGRRGVLWYVSRETGNFPVHFTMLSLCRFINHACMSDVPVRWMDAVPCRRHAMRGVPYMSDCGVSRYLLIYQSVVGRHMTAYMGVPPLFSFLGGSESGTDSGACIGLFVGIITLAGIGEAECDMTLYMASDGFWDCPICIRTQDSMTLSIVCECNQ